MAVLGRRRSGMLPVVLAAMALAAGCLPSGPDGAPPGSRSCLGVPAEQCEQAFADAEAAALKRGSLVAGIVIRCSRACTPAGGEALVTITYADGTTDGWGFGWAQAAPGVPGGFEPFPGATAGDPGPPPSLAVAPTCIGLDAAICDERVAEALETVPDAGTIASIVVRCTGGPCTDRQGEGETSITLADGSSTSIGWSYASGP